MKRIVMITGGGSGIGRALCQFFAEKGWIVNSCDRSREMGDETVKSISTMSPESLSLQADIREAGEIKMAIQACLKQHGRIDALVNNAGVTDKEHKTLLDLSYEVWREVISINLIGTFTVLKEFATAIKDQGHGNIVNITSLLGQRGYTRVGDTVYGVSKGAVETLTEYASTELKEHGINVNSAFPAAMVNTNFFDYLSDEERSRLEKPAILNELVYVLCCLEPGDMSGKAFSAQDWKEDPEIRTLAEKVIAE